ncbi:MAG: hypothetical protein JWN01_616 [Patescibacteria group bacterium]|nr:hypothetical protein [Patescibacteria group bacterium]
MTYDPQSSPAIKALIAVWQPFTEKLEDWQSLVKTTEPKETYCGPVYEPASPLDRPNESFAIADMRQVKVAEPHYHANGETEIYFVISGTGLTVVGGEEIPLSKGTIVATPPGTAHFTIPRENLVMVVINTPPFNPENNIHLPASNPMVKFDHEQFARLCITEQEKYSKPAQI